jgi:hypothetical protein
MLTKTIGQLDEVTSIASSDVFEIEASGVSKKVAFSTIIESGSNSAGSYIKFADGSMICAKNVSANIDVSNTTGSIFYCISSSCNRSSYGVYFSGGKIRGDCSYN